MGARGGDRSTGRTLPLGWGDQNAADGAPDPLAMPVPPGMPGTLGSSDAVAPPDSSALGEGSASPLRSARVRRFLAVGCVVVLVLVLFVGLPQLLGSTAGPKRATSEFLQAVIDGDLETVRARVEDAPDASAAALTAQVLSEADDRLESFEIEQVTVTAETALVTASLRTGTATSEVTFVLTSTDSGHFAPAVWELAPVALPEFVIDLPFGAREITINDVPFGVDDFGTTADPFSSRVAVQLLPGTYEVSLPGSQRWLEASTLTLDAPPAFGNWRKRIHGLEYTLDEEGLQEVQRQVDSALEECLDSGAPAREGCPFAVPGPPAGAPASTAAQGTWSLTNAPQVDVFSGDVLLWMLQGEGTAQFTPNTPAADDAQLDLADASAPIDAPAAAPVDVPFDVEGTAIIDREGELEVTLRSLDSLSYVYCVDPETGDFNGVVIIVDSEHSSPLWDDCG